MELWGRKMLILFRMSNSHLLTPAERRFRLWAWITLTVIYLVILAGGIVRTTGSGMGCPDWPKCFGSYIPPTDISQLSPDYRERFRVAGKVIAPFNVVHTWTEYANRLVGALSGIAAFVMMIMALFIWRKHKSAFYLSLATFILLGLQGILGKYVVSTNLDVSMITWHMLLALVIVFVMVVNISWKDAPRGSYDLITPKGLKILPALSLVTLLLMLVQIVIGTDVREHIDQIAIANEHQQRGTWIAQVGLPFIVHRSFSILVTVMNILTIVFIYRETRNMGAVYLACSFIYFLIGAEVIAGMVLAYLDFPAWAQPVHLWLAMVWAGVNFFVFLLLFKQFYDLKMKQGQKQPALA